MVAAILVPLILGWTIGTSLADGQFTAGGKRLFHWGVAVACLVADFAFIFHF